MKDIYTQLKVTAKVRYSQDEYKKASENILAMFTYTYCTLCNDIDVRFGA